MNAENQINKLDWLRKSIIGRNIPFETPFGTKPLVYADYTASGRAVDFIEDYRLINALRKGIELDMDVYDAAAWIAVCELSERSVAGNSKPIIFPDFTRGMWKRRRALQVDNFMDV